jgi:hypothetical protein
MGGTFCEKRIAYFRHDQRTTHCSCAGRIENAHAASWHTCNVARCPNSKKHFCKSSCACAASRLFADLNGRVAGGPTVNASGYSEARPTRRPRQAAEGCHETRYTKAVWRAPQRPRRPNTGREVPPFKAGRARAKAGPCAPVCAPERPAGPTTRTAANLAKF